MTTALIWNKTHADLYKRLYNKLLLKYKDIEVNNYLNVFTSDLIFNFINNIKLGSASHEAFFFMVARWYSINQPTNENINKFKEAGYAIKQEREKHDKNNTIDQQHKDTYHSLKYFNKILNDINVDKITNINDHYQYLILALVTLQPVMRTGVYTTLQMRTKPPQDDDPVTATNNFLILETINNKQTAYFIILSDKVSNTATHRDRSKIEILNLELIKILYDSFIKYKRSYLFEIKNKRLNQVNILNYLREITNLPKLNMDIMRSIYITEIYDKKITYHEKEELARSMRHTVATASTAYYKITDTEDEQKEKKETDMNLEIENVKLKKIIHNLKPDEESSLYKKRRADALFRLKKGLTVKPDTLIKYKLTVTA